MVTASPARAKFAVFETVATSGESALAGDEIAPLATIATAVTLRASDLINLFMIYLFFSIDRDDVVSTS